MNPSSRSVLIRLSVMMFLQFFAWGSWFATLALAMGNNGLSGSIGGAYESAPIAAIFAPLFLGLVADRLFSSERVMGVLMLIGGGIMCAIATMAPQGAEKGGQIVWLMIAYSPGLKFDLAKANQFVRRDYRAGWKIQGLG